MRVRYQTQGARKRSKEHPPNVEARMVTLHQEPAGASQSDRRRVPRRPMQGGGMAVFSNGHGAGTLVRVDLIDASWVGIGVKSPVKVEPGSSVSLVPDSAMWPRQTGVVVRCEEAEDGFIVGLLSKRSKAVA